MVYKLIVSRNAHSDIDMIVGYMVNELKSTQAASSFLDEVRKSYRSLAENPKQYALCRDGRLERMGYRKVVIKNYLVLYRINEEAKAVYVVRIVYGGRNYATLL